MAIPPQPPPAAPIRPFVAVLNPAWRQVEYLAPRDGPDAMQDGDDDEWEEDEVEYVTLEFAQNLREEELVAASEMQLLAPESKTPYVRIGHQYFQGTHEMLIGNDILLQHDDKATPAYRPFATSSHRINFQPIDLQFTPGKRLAKLEEEAAAAAAEASGRRPGRPKGSRNKLKPGEDFLHSTPAPPPAAKNDGGNGDAAMEDAPEAGPSGEGGKAGADAEERAEGEGRRDKGKGKAERPPDDEGAGQPEGMDED
ncbi:hypothetical protein JCM8097_002707 [Rhodosporidiobolus ruineniae]